MKKVLFLGSHCDDIELGCGATIHKHHQNWDITCVSFAGHATHINYEHLDIISRKALCDLGVKKAKYFYFEINNFHKKRQQIWERLHELELEIQPDVVFTQHPDDQQDHELLYKESVRNFRKATLVLYVSAFRNCRTVEPNYYEEVSQQDVDAKQKCLRHYPEWYINKNYFFPENVEAKMRTDGLYPELEFAEAYKIVRGINLI